MEERIDLWDMKPFERWCLQEDIDLLVDSLLSADVAVPKGVLCITPILTEVDGVQHFVEGSTLHIVRLKPRVRKKKLDDTKVALHIITYHQFMSTLYKFVEVWLHELPFKGGGRIDVENFSLLELKRFLVGLME